MDLLKLKRSDIKKIQFYGGYKTKTAQTVINEFSDKPDYIINAVHFDNSIKSKTYGMSISDTIIDETFVNGGNYNHIYRPCGIAFNTIEDLCYCSTTEAINQNYKFFMGASPQLIEDNKIVSTYLNTGFMKTKTKRIGIGFNDTDLIISFPTYNCQGAVVAQNLLKNGCNYAIALDGGGSQFVGKVVDGKVSHLDNNKCNRAVSTWILIWLKNNSPSTPTQNVPLFQGKKAIGIAEVTWQTLNRRTNAGSTEANTLVNPALKKGDRITVFDQKNIKGSIWYYSYGYWIAANGTKMIERY